MALHPTRQFRRAIGDDPTKCILWVGAGLSASGVRKGGRGLPDWNALMQRMIDDLRDSESCEPAALQNLDTALKDGKYLEVAQAYKQRTRPDQFAAFIKAELDPPDIAESKVHQTILRINFRGIITTNFDRVFERQSDLLVPLVYPQCLDDVDGFRRDRFFAKIHGCVRITPNLAENLILTEESFRSLRSNPKYQTILRSWFVTHSILTAGFSLNDPDFLGLVSDLRESLGNSMPTIYALMRDPGAKPERFRLKKGTPFGVLVVMKPNQAQGPRREADQTVRLAIDTKSTTSSIRISFTDQRLTAHGGMVVWSHFLQQKRFRQQLREVLPHCPTSPNAYDPTDVALGYMGGILCGADKLSRVAWLQSDPALSQVLGVEAIASQSTLSRFFAVFGQKACNALNGLHREAAASLPSLPAGYTLDLDSWALLHEDGQQQGVAVGYTRQGLKPCHRPLIAALAESKLIANYWLRRGDSRCANGAAEFLQQTVQGLPAHIRLKLVRGDAGFGEAGVQDMAQTLGLKFIFVARLTQTVQSLCRHDAVHWQPTEIPGLEVQEVALDQPTRRLIVIRQHLEQRRNAGGKTLLDVPSHRFQALVTNLPRSVDALNVWRQYNGRADLENRIKELGQQFGIKRLCVDNFWGTEAMHHLAIAAYNLCVLLQRRLGQLEKCELNTLRWRLFGRAAVWSRAQGKPTLKLAVHDRAQRSWWHEILAKLTALPNCNAVASLQA